MERKEKFGFGNADPEVTKVHASGNGEPSFGKK